MLTSLLLCRAGLQLQDIPAAAAPPLHPTDQAGAAEAPTVAADQHSIDFSKQPPRHSRSSQKDPAASWVQHLSWHPRLHMHHNFLTPEECDKMKGLLARPSGVVGGSNTGSPEDEEASLLLMIDIEQRLANWAALPPSHLEGWQVSPLTRCACDDITTGCASFTTAM